jgi:hypothetical protein
MYCALPTDLFAMKFLLLLKCAKIKLFRNAVTSVASLYFIPTHFYIINPTVTKYTGVENYYGFYCLSSFFKVLI